MRRCALVVAVLFAGCGDDGGSDDGPGRVAMLAPSTGPLRGVGQSFELAVVEDDDFAVGEQAHV